MLKKLAASKTFIVIYNMFVCMLLTAIRSTTTVPIITEESTASLCSEDHQFYCANKAGCIPRRWVCDGEGDCSDKSDEANCGNNTLIEIPNEYSRNCISPAAGGALACRL